MTVLDEHTSDGDLATWTEICDLQRLTPDRGVAALVGGRALAIFRLSTGALHAIDNIDPWSGASIMSRGLVGDVEGAPTVASPMYKQRFALASGRCLDGEVEPLAVHDVQVVDGVVLVRLGRVT